MIPAVLLGGLATTYINIDLGFGAVIGSAAVGLAGAYVPADFPEKGVGLQIRTGIYCGSFIGMSQVLTDYHYAFISFASVLSGIVFMCSGQILNGFGGKLGTLAFVGVSLAIFFLFITQLL